MLLVPINIDESKSKGYGMIEILKKSLWKHFGASIDMFENAMVMWPEELWYSKKRFFYISHHCLVFLDYYLTIPPKVFIAQLPYTITAPENTPEDALDDVVPDRIYSRNEMLDYLRSAREKCRNFIAGLTESQLDEPWINNGENMYLDLSGTGALHFSVLEILLHNMRHVQHHVAQLNLLLRQTIGQSPDYVSAARN